jgi:uncharacterized protein
MNKVFKYFLLTVLSFVVLTIHAQLPERPVPPKLVNDFADILSSSEEKALERKLVHYNDTTSTQITIVTIADLQGNDKAQYAVELAHKWGVGQKGKDNGLLILVKPKQPDSRGQAYIAVGYGLEEYVPDATALLVVENDMLPFFRENRMYDGLDAATNSLMGLLSGEFTAEQYGQRGAGAGDMIGIIVFMIIVVVFIFAGRSRKSQHGLSSRAAGFPWWIFLFTSGGGSSSGSGWSNFSGGSGSFGGGSSFGGFGGGGFGGGGAGGSW